MNIQTEAVHTAEFLLSESNREISREAITVAAGDPLPAGQVLGIQTATGHYAAYSPAATDGTEVAVGILHAALPASADVRNGVAFARLAEVAAARLTGLDAAAIADLKTRHLIVR